ncbi:MAG: sigma-70 family RNA polymerase sigma factor [Deltaproteobacteria bacterium]|nr:sigma-70 family RNA polymerase sigma factor [Deltaproteobacteria bacterium]
MTDLKERLLIRRLKRGNPEAFRTLIDLYQQRIYNLCFRFMGNRADAEDVAQDVFCTIFLKVGTFRGDSSLSTWIYRIAINHSKNKLKYLARRKTESLDNMRAAGTGLNNPDSSNMGGPAKMLESSDLKNIVQEEILYLDEERRLVLILRDIQELSYSEITRITGLPVGTVKSRLHRARMALKDRLDRRLKGAGQDEA